MVEINESSLGKRQTTVVRDISWLECYGWNIAESGITQYSFCDSLIILDSSLLTYDTNYHSYDRFVRNEINDEQIKEAKQ